LTFFTLDYSWPKINLFNWRKIMGYAKKIMLMNNSCPIVLRKGVGDNEKMSNVETRPQKKFAPCWIFDYDV
jgi:hypothetical protein